MIAPNTVLSSFADYRRLARRVRRHGQGDIMAIIDDLIAHYVKLNETLARHISFIENGGTITPAGASHEQAADATADWLEKLMKYHAEYETIISELNRRAALS